MLCSHYLVILDDGPGGQLGGDDGEAGGGEDVDDDEGGKGGEVGGDDDEGGNGENDFSSKIHFLCKQLLSLTDKAQLQT